MSKKMLINATHPEENRVAIVEDGILTELDIEIAGKEQTKGNIYKAAVVRVESGLQAAFVDYGGDRLGFLQMGEIHPSIYRNKENKSRPRINDVLHRGQELLVQIVKEERGTKGAALTTFLSLPGRYMVLMPDSDTRGVSRKIADEGQRRKLKETMASLDLPDGFGYIVRTAAIAQSKEELKRDFTYLQRLCESIESLNKRVKPPALVYRESNLIIRSIRDYFSTDMDEVLVDDEKVFQEARDFFQQVMPEYARLVKLHQERRPIYARYQIEEQIETISKSKVPLPSGGSIVIDSTEALVAVDVNSGKLAGEQGVEATAYRTNLEAAAEVGRQLRLRDLGGLIVIDFIDMRERKHDRDVEKRLKQALKNDKARVTVGRISQFGLLEMSRQRIKATLAEGAYLSCPHCNGSGRVKSIEAQAVAFLRKLQAGIAKGQIGTVEGEIPLDVATYLLNTKREELHEMERQRDVEIFIKGRPDFVAGQAELTFQRRSADKEKQEDEVIEAGSLPEPVAPEPEVTPAAAEAAPPAEGAEDAAGESGGKRRRRRRRRRKPAAEKPAAAAAAGEGTEKPGTEPAPEEKREEGAPEIPAAAAATPETATAAEAPVDEGKDRPARSRGRGRKKPAAAAQTSSAEEGAETKPVTKETAGGTGEEAPEAAGSEGEAKSAESPEPVKQTARPARPRSRRRKTPETEKPPEVAADPAMEKETPEEGFSPEEKPKRRTRKRASASVEKATAGAESAVAAPAAEEGTAAESTPVESSPRPAPRRGRPKKGTAEPEAPSTDQKQTAAVPADQEEKPKRRTRKKASVTEQEDGEKKGPEKKAKKAPSKKKEAEEKSGEGPKTKKTVPKKTAARGKTAAAAEKTGTGEEPSGKPAKPRAPRKKAAATKKAETEEKEEA